MRSQLSSALSAPPDNPDYPLWYCPAYPVALLGTAAIRPEFREAFEALKADIDRRGLINPLIVLNHRDPTNFKKNWVMTGRNRLTAIRELGWGTVAALVTGECNFPATEVPPAAVGELFRDGEVYFGTQGPRLRGMTRFEKGEFPCLS